MNGEGRGDPVSRCGGAPSSTGWSFAAGSWIAVTLAVASLAMAPLAGCRTTTREDPPPGPAATGAADATSPPGAMAAGDAAGAGLAGRAGRAAGASAEDAASGRRIHVLGGSAEGRPIEAHVIGDGAQSVLILATIHGDEWAGTPLLEELAEVLEALASAGDLDARVVLVPIANPDGYAEGTRESSTGVDLNRNFPSSNYDARRGHGAGPLSEPESGAVAAAVGRTPQRHGPRQRLRTGWSLLTSDAARLVVVGAVVALFGGVLLAGELTQPSEDRVPAATSASPSPSAATEYEVTRVDRPDGAKPSVATDDASVGSLTAVLGPTNLARDSPPPRRSSPPPVPDRCDTSGSACLFANRSASAASSSSPSSGQIR